MMMGLMDRRVPRESRHSAAVGSQRNVKRVEPSVDGHSDMNFNMEFSKNKNEREKGARWSTQEGSAQHTLHKRLPTLTK